MKIQTKTIKIRKTYVFAFVFLIIAGVTVYMLFNAFREYQEALPEALTDTENIELIQFEIPEENADTAVISTTAGDISIVLYKNEAPNAVRIFKDAAASGTYDGLNVGLYEQGSVFTLDVPDLESGYTAELHKNLWPFKGAVCMTENGDLVFINTVEFTDEDREYLSAEGELADVRAAFLEHGGVPNYARQYAVFGQVTDGMDVLEKIARSPQASVITVTGVTIEEKNE